ncbi:MAG: DUF2264 domain-containing protein [Oscillospiraceae bacterium]|nr:DUF2264 domain-containing protein [Oscillospiraceae bacterium]
MKLQNRADFEALMLRILDPLKPLYSPGGALLPLGQTGTTYPRRTIEMEGFSRPLWALAPYWMGGGRAEDFAQIYRRGLAAGTNPENAEYWGDPQDCDQLFVEMAAIAAAILEVPGTIWDPLSDSEKQNLSRWLDTINHHSLPHCNWLFFRILVNLALDSVGMPCDLALMEQDLDEVDSWYVGSGWYTDGTPNIKPQRDYYIPWAIQYYGVLYSVFAAERDPERAEVFRERAMAFGKEFAFWFDENGAALPYGRSLGYRFGQCAFYSACVFAGLEPLPLPVMKGIIVRNLQWWCEKPIFDRDGVLTIGYTYPQLYMSEQYNSPGSPYWGMKTFLVIALPETHPFWSAPAAPLPAMPAVYAMKNADLLMQRLPDGQVNAYAPAEVEKNEHGQFAEKYAKFVYNTRFGFSASRSYAALEQAAPDSMLAFVLGGQVFVRRRSESFTLLEDRLISRWSPFMGITVVTELIPTAKGHLRRHRVESAYDCAAWDCGFAVPKFREGFAVKTEGGRAEARNAAQCCTVTGKSGEGVIIGAWPNTSLYDPNTVIPAVKYAIPAGVTELETLVESEADE